MKIRILLSSAVLAALFAQATFGQAATATDPAARHAQMLSQMLTLTAAQQTQVQAILATEENAVKANQTQLQTLRTNLITAIKSNDTGGINSITMQISPLRQQDDAARAIAAAQIYAVLTPDQQTKVNNGVEMLAGMGGGRGPGGPGPMMHRGGPR